MPSSRITSLCWKGYSSHLLRVLEQKEMIPGTAYIRTLIIRTPTFSFWFSVSWDVPTSAFFHSREYVQYFMIPGTCYVPDAYDTRYVLYRYLFIRTWVVVRMRAWVVVCMRAWVVVRMTPTFRPTNSCIVSGWWYAWYLRSTQETAVSSRVPYEVPFSSRCTTKSIAKNSPTGSLPPAVPLAITRTFRPWTHTSDDSYIYQLSLVVATAIVSFPTFGAPNPTKSTLQRSNFLERRAPSEAWIGGNISGCHCR